MSQSCDREDGGRSHTQCPRNGRKETPEPLPASELYILPLYP